ncbi:MAG: hypothetical protein ACRDZ2_05120 [Ilumatobacteraceae bacterium]
MIAEKLTGATVLDLQLQAAGTAVQNLVERDPDDGEHVVPGAVRRALAELRLLHHVPFSYLVADASLLPPESIRFFYLDRNWTDAVVQGVLNVGTFTAADRRQLEELMPIIRDEVDEAERVVRRPTGEERLEGRGGAITGLVMRSKLVSGWPGLHVRAYHTDRQLDADIIPESDPDRLKVLRLERLAPAVLLVLFDGVPAVVHIEEPRQGIQFGALRPIGEPMSTKRDVPLRNATTGADLTPRQDVPVPFRRDAAGVINLAKLRQRMVDVTATQLGSDVEANEFALEMLRFPFRQVFGDPANEPSEDLRDVFTPRVEFGTLLARFEAVIR